jgi:type III restriction enzyme
VELRAIKHTKNECARKFFDEINRKIDQQNVKYDVVSSYGKLMEIVGMRPTVAA